MPSETPATEPAMEMPGQKVLNVETKAFIGCAGWSLPKEEKAFFPESGTHLERYAGVFNAVEINSSFYRPHRTATYERWASSVPADFRFSVKVPKAITHTARLANPADLLAEFLDSVSGLGEKLGCLLVQLPPSLEYAPDVAREFLETLRELTQIPIVFEPRHPSWFGREAEALFKKFHVARAAVDPEPVPGAASPGGWKKFTYFRLHGAPRIYYSAYSDADIHRVAEQVKAAASQGPVWCIFDNTALGAAIPNARLLQGKLRGEG